MSTLLEVQDLVVRFYTQEGTVYAVNGVSFDLEEGETLGIVGESGSGKSVSCLALMGLIPSPPGKVESGTVVFEGRDLLTLKPDQMRLIRGKEIAMIFQDPMTSLNPVLTIGTQITESLKLHEGMNTSQSRKRAADLLDLVGIPDAYRRLDDYPHQFSGGMRQRVMIAMGLSCNPKLLIADEPTTALDVTIQAQIIELVKQLKDEFNMAMIWITHDLGRGRWHRRSHPSDVRRPNHGVGLIARGLPRQPSSLYGGLARLIAAAGFQRRRKADAN